MRCVSSRAVLAATYVTLAILVALALPVRQASTGPHFVTPSTAQLGRPDDDSARKPVRMRVERCDGVDRSPKADERGMLDGRWIGSVDGGTVVIELDDGVGSCSVEKDGAHTRFDIAFAEYWSRRRITFVLQPHGRQIRFVWDAVVLGDDKLGIERVDMYDRLFPTPFDLHRRR
jgi:hypothetical protein